MYNVFQVGMMKVFVGNKRKVFHVVQIRCDQCVEREALYVKFFVCGRCHFADSYFQVRVSRSNLFDRFRKVFACHFRVLVFQVIDSAVDGNCVKRV